jgi:uncharacterized membrane protein HdeD (DUF308 family)
MLQLMEETMEMLTRNWWLFILRGVFAILFGILIVAWPSAGILVLVILFGVYALADGILSITFAFTHKGNWGHRAWLIFWGIVGIVAGVVALAWPGITALALLYVIAVWAFVIGIAELVFAIATPTSVGNRVLLALGGIFSIIFGIFLVARPSLGALAVIWIIGIFAVMFGVYHIAFGISLKDLKTKALVK